jgi:DNA-binding MurR/RpiR family transcriptional regulator
MRFEDVVQQQWPSLTKSQKLFAEFAIKDPQVVAVASADKVGRRLGLSASTVVRAAQTIGYPGYPELQEAIRTELFARSRLIDRLEVTERDHTDPIGVGHRTVEADINMLEQTILTLSADTVTQVSGALYQARRIYIYGIGLSFASAHVLTIGLHQLGHDAVLASASPTDIADALHNAGGDDLLVAIAMPRYPNRTVAALEFAGKLGLKRVAITDNATSPLAEHADLSLYVNQSSFRYFPSVVPTMSVVNALITTTAVMNAESTRSNLVTMEAEWLASGAFHHGDSGRGHLRRDSTL